MKKISIFITVVGMMVMLTACSKKDAHKVSIEQGESSDTVESGLISETLDDTETEKTEEMEEMDKDSAQIASTDEIVEESVTVLPTEKTEDRIMYQIDFSLQEENGGTISLLGHRIDEREIGITTIEIQMDTGEMVSIPLKKAVYDSWGSEEYGDLAVSRLESCGLQLEDINFDGYTDLGLEIRPYAWGSVYGYWIYNSSVKQYEYYGHFTNSFSVNADTQTCTVYRREGTKFYLDYYQVDDMHRLYLKKTEIESWSTDGKSELETIYYE